MLTDCIYLDQLVEISVFGNWDLGVADLHCIDIFLSSKWVGPVCYNWKKLTQTAVVISVAF